MAMIVAKDEPLLTGTYSVHDVVEKIGFGRFQVVLSILCGLLMMADAMEIMLLSILSPALVCEWQITSFEQAFGTTAVFIGWAIASPFWGWFCDRHGRKRGLVLASLLGGVAGLATAFSPNFATFVFMRGCVGLAVAGAPQATTLYTEFLPTASRAKCVVFLEVWWAIGCAFEALLALVVMPIWGWRGLVVFSSIPLFLFAFCCFLLPESPRFYVSRGKMTRAFNVLSRISAMNKKQLPEGDLTSEPPSSKPSFKILINKEWRRTSILLWILWICFAFTYYGVTLYTTKIVQSTDPCHGGSPAQNVTASFDPHAPGSSGVCKQLTSEQYIDILKTSFSEVPGLVLVALLIDRIGRRKTIALQYFIFALSNFALLVCMSESMIIAVIFVARAVASGALQCIYVYTPEVYPTTLRARAIGTASTFARLGAMATPLVAQMLGDFSMKVSLLVYGLSGIIGTVAALLLPIETAGREMRDIH